MPAEDVAEVATEIAEVELLEAHAAEVRPRAAREAARAGLAERVVRLPLLGVREDVVGALHLLEALLGAVVAGVPVRVVLARELAIRLLDVVVGRVLRDAEHLVGVTCHRRSSR